MAEDRLKAWQTLFARALEILDSGAIRDWTFGGGTVLMRRYRHRLSNDIDIFVPDPQSLGYLSPRLNPTAESLTSDYFEHANFLKLYFPEGEIDFVASGALTDQPAAKERILDRDIMVETSTEIIAKKIWHRAAVFTARDLFDLAFIAGREPDSLCRIEDILAGRGPALLKRLREHENALREDFAALVVLEFRPSFDECVNSVRLLLGQQGGRLLPRAEQRRARYEVARSDPPMAAVGLVAA